MTHLPWLIQTHFKSLGNSSISLRKQIIRAILGNFLVSIHNILFLNMRQVLSHQGNSNAYTQHTIILDVPKLLPFAS